MTIEEILRGAREVLLTHGWTQGTRARAESGMPTAPLGERAVSFCMQGAMFKALGAENEAAIDHAQAWVEAVINRDGGLQSMSYWNDQPGRGKGEVLDLLEEAANRATARPMPDDLNVVRGSA